MAYRNHIGTSLLVMFFSVPTLITVYQDLDEVERILRYDALLMFRNLSLNRWAKIYRRYLDFEI